MKDQDMIFFKLSRLKSSSLLSTICNVLRFTKRGPNIISIMVSSSAPSLLPVYPCSAFFVLFTLGFDLIFPYADHII